MPDIERLRQLRRVVEAAPDERFYMGAFSRVTDCGTAYCAAGWAARDPWFRANTPINRLLRIALDGSLVVSPRDDPPSLGDIFGLEADDEHNLFYPDADLSRGDVIANIDRLIRGLPTVNHDEGDGS